MKKIQLLFLTSILFLACNNNSKETKQEATTVQEVQKKCDYSLLTKDMKFTWTAFKTTEKIAVNGTFDEIVIETTNESIFKNIPDLLKMQLFYINPLTINSENEVRDKKLIEFFFGNLVHTEAIKGYVKEVEGDNFKGTVFLILAMNEIEKAVEMKYEVKENLIYLNGHLDLLSWGTKNSLESLHLACEDKHKGKDGISKTWSDIDINLILPITKVCY